MNNSLTAINSLLVDIKTINNSLFIQFQKSGFSSQLLFGLENEYTLTSLNQAIDTLVIHFLTITANRQQFLQRTSYNERKAIETHLKALYLSLKTSQNHLLIIEQENLRPHDQRALCYIDTNGETQELPLIDSIHHIDLLKPYSRMLELIIAQERIHALSAVLETLLHSNPQVVDPANPQAEGDDELKDEQQEVLELSHYFIKQAL